MKTALGALLVLAALAAAIPAAQAQVPAGLALEAAAASQPSPIPFMGTAQQAFNVTVGCSSVLRALGETQGATVTVTAATPPAWLTVTPGTVDLADPSAAADCLAGAGSVTRAVSAGLAVSRDAPGVAPNLVEFTATLGMESSEPVPVPVTVAYHWNYSLSADARFPLAVTGPSVTFNLTVTQASNARSMVMMEEVKASAGVVSGLASTVYESEAGKPATKTFKVTYTPPAGAWNETTVSFKAYGHYLLLDSSSGPYDAGKAVTWTFTNAAPQEPEEEGKDASAPVGALLALGLVALAALVRRRA